MATECRVTIDITEVNVKENTRIECTQYQDFVRLPCLIDNISEYNKGITGEQNLVKLDGDYNLYDRDKAGFYSNLLSNETGVFSPAIVIKAMISQTVDSAFLKIYFEDTYATNFIVLWFLNDTEVSRKEVVNTENICIVQNPVFLFNKVFFAFTKSDKPFRYIKISEIDFGEQLVLGSADLTSGKITDETDYLSDTISINTLDISVLNKDQQYNILNTNSVYRVLHKNQKMKCELITNSTGITPLGVYYLNTWENTNAPTAKLTGEDIIGVFDDIPCEEGIYSGSTVTAEALFNGLFYRAKFTNYEIDKTISTISLTGFTSKGTVRTALQELCVATMATIKVTRFGRVLVLNKSLNATSKHVDKVISAEKITETKENKGVEVEYFTFSFDAEGKVKEEKKATQYPVGATTTTTISNNKLITTKAQADKIAKYWYDFINEYSLDVEYDAILPTALESSDMATFYPSVGKALRHYVKGLDIDVVGGYIGKVKGCAKLGS